VEPVSGPFHEQPRLVLAHCGPTPAHDGPLVVPASGARMGATSLPSTELGSLETAVSARENGANRALAAHQAELQGDQTSTLCQHELSREPVVGVLMHALPAQRERT
jgi:hypothetical protein